MEKKKTEKWKKKTKRSTRSSKERETILARDKEKRRILAKEVVEVRQRERRVC